MWLAQYRWQPHIFTKYVGREKGHECAGPTPSATWSSVCLQGQLGRGSGHVNCSSLPSVMLGKQCHQSWKGHFYCVVTPCRWPGNCMVTEDKARMIVPTLSLPTCSHGVVFCTRLTFCINTFCGFLVRICGYFLRNSTGLTVYAIFDILQIYFPRTNFHFCLELLLSAK